MSFFDDVVSDIGDVVKGVVAFDKDLFTGKILRQSPSDTLSDVLPANQSDHDKAYDAFRKAGISEQNLGEAWKRVTDKGFKPDAIDPSKSLADSDRLSGVRLQEAAGEGLGGMFGFSKDFGVGGLNPASPLQPGAPAGLMPLTSLPPIGR